MEEVAKRYAVVTGSNKGIGFEICRQLASKGITVVLTTRDEKRGLEAVEKIKQFGCDNLVFHQLDVANPSSIHFLADFIKTHFGKLDILVNNAAINGVIMDGDALSGLVKVLLSKCYFKLRMDGVPIKWNEITTETCELVEKCIETNYYGAKRMCEALIPPSSSYPMHQELLMFPLPLEIYRNERAIGVLSDVENLIEEKVDEILREYVNDFKQDSLETKGWPTSWSAYIMWKASLNAYTRILAKRYSNFLINCVCPGIVKTDMTNNTGVLTPEEGDETSV